MVSAASPKPNKPEAGAQLVKPNIADLSPIFWAGRRLDPAQVRVILRQAAAGDLQAQYELFSMMEDTWPRLLKNLFEVRDAASRGTFTVSPYAARGEKPSASAQSKADLVEAAMKNWLPKTATLEFGFEDALFHALDAYGKGISVLEIGWQQTPEGTLPRCAHMVSPRSYGWNADGNELGLTSAPVGGYDPATVAPWQPFPAGQFWCGISHARTGAPGATARLRCLAPYWVGITFGWEWLLQTAQIFGVPFRWATYDPNRPDLLPNIVAMLSQMSVAGYGAFPAGTTLDFKDAISRSQDNPQVLIQALADKACDLVILGQEGSGAQHSQGLNGSGQSELQGEVRREVLHGAAQWCANLLNYQLVPSLLAFNFGDVTEPPTIVPDLAGDPDPVKLAQRDLIVTGLAPVPLKWFYERHGIPPPEGDEETIGGPSATLPPPDGGASLGSPAPGGEKGLPASGDAQNAPAGKSPMGQGKMAGGAGKARISDPPRSAVPSSASGSEADPVAANENPRAVIEKGSSVPGAYRMPEATRAALAAAHARDFAPLRKAAAPMLAAIEAGDLAVVGEIEDFIAHLDALAPQMIGASQVADALEAALAEASIAGAAAVYGKTPNAKTSNSK